MKAAAKRSPDVLRGATARLRAAGVEDAQRDARELLAFLLGCRPAEAASRREPLDAVTLRQFDALLAERLRRKPLAYVLRQAWFGDLRLEVGPSVLVPRPETEELFEWAASELTGARGAGRLLDVGTGSGCLAIALAKRFSRAAVTAVDVSEEALEVARRNAKANGVAGRVRFVKCDLLAALDPAERFSAIVANLPYVNDDDVAVLPPEVLHEPRLALEGGPDGLAVVRRLVPRALKALEPVGALYLEVGYDQARETAAMLRKAGFARVEVRRDMAGIQRFVKGLK